MDSIVHITQQMTTAKRAQVTKILAAMDSGNTVENSNGDSASWNGTVDWDKGYKCYQKMVVLHVSAIMPNCIILDVIVFLTKGEKSCWGYKL